MLRRVFGPGRELIGGIEYDGDRDVFLAYVVPAATLGATRFHDADEAERWIRDQHLTSQPPRDGADLPEE